MSVANRRRSRFVMRARTGFGRTRLTEENTRKGQTRDFGSRLAFTGYVANRLPDPRR